MSDIAKPQPQGNANGKGAQGRATARHKKISICFALAATLMGGGVYGAMQVPDALLSVDSMKEYLNNCKDEPVRMDACALGQLAHKVPYVLAFPLGSFVAGVGVAWYAAGQRPRKNGSEMRTRGQENLGMEAGPK